MNKLLENRFLNAKITPTYFPIKLIKFSSSSACMSYDTSFYCDNNNNDTLAKKNIGKYKGIINHLMFL